MKYLLALLLALTVYAKPLTDKEAHGGGSRGLNGCKHGFVGMDEATRIMANRIYTMELKYSLKAFPNEAVIGARVYWLGDYDKYDLGGSIVGKEWIGDKHKWVVIGRRIEAGGVVLLVRPVKKIWGWGSKPIWIRMLDAKIVEEV